MSYAPFYIISLYVWLWPTVMLQILLSVCHQSLQNNLNIYLLGGRHDTYQSYSFPLSLSVCESYMVKFVEKKVLFQTSLEPIMWWLK